MIDIGNQVLEQLAVVGGRVERSITVAGSSGIVEKQKDDGQEDHHAHHGADDSADNKADKDPRHGQSGFRIPEEHKADQHISDDQKDQHVKEIEIADRRIEDGQDKDQGAALFALEDQIRAEDHQGKDNHRVHEERIPHSDKEHSSAEGIGERARYRRRL